MSLLQALSDECIEHSVVIKSYSTNIPSFLICTALPEVPSKSIHESWKYFDFMDGIFYWRTAQSSQRAASTKGWFWNSSL